MMGTMYFLGANCAQNGGGACDGGLICASLLSYMALVLGSSVPVLGSYKRKTAISLVLKINIYIHE